MAPVLHRGFLLGCLVLAGPIASQGANDATRRPTAGPVTVSGDVATFEIAWANAWRDERSHDAAWIILRTADPHRGPLRIAPKGHEIEGNHPGSVRVSDDRLGVFVEPAKAMRGNVRWRVRLRLEQAAGDLETPPAAWATGMVRIPAGAFEAGDADPICLGFGSFHAVDEAGEPTGPFPVASELGFAIAKRRGALWYRSGRYVGDATGIVPSTWPKGTRAFYVMKHEVSQGEYRRFIQFIAPEWRARRIDSNLQGEDRGTFTIESSIATPEVMVAAPERPCNFLSWSDSCAYFDWLALRPMTELEFEKAARGPKQPVPHDYPWGTASTEGVERRVDRNRDVALATVAAEARVPEGRVRLAASYYGVFDLAGSLWERVVTLGHPAGRSFRGTHGDGVLSEQGDGTNADWPTQAGEDAPGVGYRGGAEYFKPARADNPTNPFSPVGLRTYGAWGGAQRYKTYSARGCRTAPTEAPTSSAIPPDQLASLRAELIQRGKRDQEVRSQDIGAMSADERKAAMKTWREVDEDNTRRMIEIVDRFGWPSIDRVGREAALAAFLMVQHADQAPDFQARCLPLLAAAAKAGHVGKERVAYLTDRVRVAKNLPQLYGTQYSVATKAKKGDPTVYLPPLVETPEDIDTLRQAMGLGPWLDYERTMARMQGREPAKTPRAWDGRIPVDHHER